MSRLHDKTNHRNQYALEHQQSERSKCTVHEVSISPDSYLAGRVGGGVLEANSTHHQAVETIAPCFNVVTRSTDDNVIEAIELRGSPRGWT